MPILPLFQANLNVKSSHYFMQFKPKFTYFSHNYTPLPVSQRRVEFHSSKSKLFGGFVSKRNYPKTMTDIELIKTSTLESSSSSKVEDGVRLSQQEGFVFITGIDSTINRSSKWIVCGLFMSVTLWRHDAEAMWALAGSVLNATLSVTLKKILKQERPVPTLRSDPGMPSSHAQSIFFIVIFVVLSIVEWQGINELSLALSGLALAFASYLSWLRVSELLHTMSQVVVGGSLAATFSILWHWSWNGIVQQAFYYSLWVRAVIYLGATAFWFGFLLYVIKNWFRDER